MLWNEKLLRKAKEISSDVEIPANLSFCKFASWTWNEIFRSSVLKSPLLTFKFYAIVYGGVACYV